MPGDYGPGGKWIHDRAHRIMEESSSPMPKSEAYAIATQQAHAAGKSPKGFSTPSGVHRAKAKYDEPKSEYQKTAMYNAFFDELSEIDKEAGAIKSALVGLGMMGALGGGLKAAPKLMARTAKPAVMQTMKASKNLAGGLSHQLKGFEMRGVMP